MSKPPTSSTVDSVAAGLAASHLDAPTLRARIAAGPDELAHHLDAEVAANNGEIVVHLGADDTYTNTDELDADVRRLVDVVDASGCRAALLRRGPLIEHAEVNGGNSPSPGPQVSPQARADGRLSAHILIRRIPQSVQDFLETRIAVVGNVDAGKSTLLGVLTKGSLDDGRGRARVNLFRHKHEIESGRTSSVGMEIMGFDAAGAPVNAAHLAKVSAGVSGAKADPLTPLIDTDFTEAPPNTTARKLSWEDVCENSAKVISFIVRRLSLCPIARGDPGTDISISALFSHRIWQATRTT